MTRFARAKGSKSSNERKPEEGTSWSELKNAMLLKNTNQIEVVNSESQKMVIKGENSQEKVEWAHFEDDEFSKSISLIKQHMGIKRKTDDSSSHEEKVINDKTSKKIKTRESDTPTSKKKKAKNLKSEPKNIKKDCKIDTKRNINETNDAVPTKKIRKEVEENTMNVETKEKESKKKKIMKPDNFKVEKNGKGKDDKKFDKVSQKFNRKQNSYEKNTLIDELIVNGKKIQIVKFQGFNVTLEDAERLKKLRHEMIKEGVPGNKIQYIIKVRRRRAEKTLLRLKKVVCFLCRGHGHLLSNCPNYKEKQDTSTGICYKCGSTEHMAMECKVVRETTFQFAECFICNEQGHIARQCPDNPRGMYPNGGACRECGDVTHLRKDCPKVLSKKAEEEITAGVRNDRVLECLEEEVVSMQKKQLEVKKKSTIKFP